MKQWVMGSDKEEQLAKRQEMDQGVPRQSWAVGGAETGDPRVAD